MICAADEQCRARRPESCRGHSSRHHLEHSTRKSRREAPDLKIRALAPLTLGVDFLREAGLASGFVALAPFFVAVVLGPVLEAVVAFFATAGLRAAAFFFAAATGVFLTGAIASDGGAGATGFAAGFFALAARFVCVLVTGIGLAAALVLMRLAAGLAAGAALVAAAFLLEGVLVVLAALLAATGFTSGGAGSASVGTGLVCRGHDWGLNGARSATKVRKWSLTCSYHVAPIPALVGHLGGGGLGGSLARGLGCCLSRDCSRRLLEGDCAGFVELFLARRHGCGRSLGCHPSRIRAKGRRFLSDLR